MIESEVLEVRVGDVHVTPEQVADANIGTFGPDDYVLSTGRKLEAQVVTNNSVRVFDGVMVYGGIRDVISVNKYYDIQIDNGAQGMNRNDIIVRHFAITDEVTKRGGATFQVIKGTPSEGEAADPEIAFTDLRAGALSHDMILHRVRIEGLNIVAVEPLYDILYNAAELKEEVTELNRKLNVSASDIISFTPLAGQTYPNWGGCYYYTSGSRVHVHLGIQGLPANTVATVFILPDIVHPKTRILSIGSSGSFPGVARTEISLDGGINVTSQDSYVAADIDYDTY